MKTIAALFFAIMMVSSGSLQARAAALRHQATIDGDVVHVGDIFIDAGAKASKVAAAAPPPGRSETYGAARLGRIAAAAGLHWRPTSRYDRVVIERTGRQITSDEIEQALRSALDGAGAPRERQIELANRNLTLYAATDAARPFRIGDVHYDDRTGRFAALVEVATGGQTADRVQITGRLYRTTAVPVLAHPMRRGEVIRKSDIEMVEMKSDTVPHNALLDKAAIIGQTPRRSVRPGTPLDPHDLQAPVIVAKGSFVTLVLHTDRMLITAQGRALEDGAAGEMIRVANTRSHTTVQGKVTGTGTVAIDFPRLAR